jgi:hypothetical protein
MYLRFTPYPRRVIVLKWVKKRVSEKSLYDLYAFLYFAMHVVMMDFLKL